MGTIKKCKITKYDETIKEAPFLTIQIDEMEVEQPDTDDLGARFANVLIQGCQTKNYIFRFYSRSEDPNYDYEVVVYDTYPTAPTVYMANVGYQKKMWCSKTPNKNLKYKN